MQIGFLSTNAHKFEETQAILAELLPQATLVQVVPQQEVDETGETFEANALIKLESGLAELGDARNDYDALIAEDAGLIVDALHGQYDLSPFPGVQSNRWLTPERQQVLLGDATFEARYDAINAGILALLDGHENRRAAYVSVLAIWQKTTQASACFKGKMALHVAQSAASGSTGFGYDPIMMLANPLPEQAGKVIAALTPVEKNAVSHRRKALTSFLTSISVTSK